MDMFDSASEAESMLKVIETMKMMNNFMNTQGEELPAIEAKDAFDANIQSPALLAMKAAIPHLEPKQRKTMSLLVKLIEIQRLIKIFDTGTKEGANEYNGPA